MSCPLLARVTRVDPGVASCLLATIFISVVTLAGGTVAADASAPSGVATADPPVESDHAVTTGWITVGSSVRGREVKARRDGHPEAGFRVLVVGSIHGDEPQGLRIVRELRRRAARHVRRFGLVTIGTVNPDGLAARTRKNARGVDLNRNFPFRFDPSLTGGYYSGPRPASEPETRMVMRLARRERFDLAIWYHQPWGVTLVPCDRSGQAATLYARLSRLRRSSGCDEYSPGSAINWLRHRLGVTAFVAELAAERLRAGQVRRHAWAVLRLARILG